MSVCVCVNHCQTTIRPGGVVFKSKPQLYLLHLISVVCACVCVRLCVCEHPGMWLMIQFTRGGRRGVSHSSQITPPNPQYPQLRIKSCHCCLCLCICERVCVIRMCANFHRLPFPPMSSFFFLLSHRPSLILRSSFLSVLFSHDALGNIVDNNNNRYKHTPWLCVCLDNKLLLYREIFTQRLRQDSFNAVGEIIYVYVCVHFVCVWPLIDNPSGATRTMGKKTERRRNA